MYKTKIITALFCDLPSLLGFVSATSVSYVWKEKETFQMMSQVVDQPPSETYNRGD